MASVDPGGDKKSVDVELEVVPLIALMSCLTAFLLVAAVWVDVAKIDVRPMGRRGHPVYACHEDGPTVSLLIDADRIHVGIAHGAFEGFPDRIERRHGRHDWERLGALLAALHRDDPEYWVWLQVAADSRPAAPVRYDDLLTAMDTARAAGFQAVAVGQPTSLAWRPTL